MKRLLVISASYAPALNARAFRWTSLAEHFAAQGCEVDVVTKPHGDAPACGVHIHRVGFRSAEAARARAARDPAGQSVARRMWRALYWPDSDCVWYWPARQESVRLARERRYHAIVSVSPSFTAVLIGRAALAANPRARWLIDLGDPFSLDTGIAFNNRALYAGLNARTERAAFAQAHAVTVTTPQTAGRYAEAFPESAAKIHVIPPLLSVPAAGADAAAFAPGTARRFVYIGTLYRQLREPGFLLQLFERLLAADPGRYELHLFGEAQAFAAELEDWRARLRGALHVHGVVPRETVVRAVADADLLVNIGNTTRDQLPSKVVEYAASGRPILNLARHADDSSVSFLETYPDCLTLFDSDAPPTPAHHDALAAFAAGLPRRQAQASVDAWLAPYRLPRIAAQYESLLQ
jgi:glycosyltransferase involved in cell wall biosynthesis